MHPSDDDLKLFSLFGLPDDETRTIQFHLLGCGSCQERMRKLTQRSSSAAGLKPRREAAIPAMSPVSVRVLDPATPMLQGWLLEMSKGAMKLLLLELLHPNTLVQMRLGRQIIMAQVRSCRPRNRGYDVEFEIQDVFLFPRQSADEAL